MRRFALFISLLLAVFAVLISTSSFAAKPSKELTVTSAPLFAQSMYCALVNVSDRAYEVTITVYSFDEVLESVTRQVEIGGYAIGGGQNTPYADFAYCEIEWEGQPGDFKASFCSQYHCLEVD